MDRENKCRGQRLEHTCMIRVEWGGGKIVGDEAREVTESQSRSGLIRTFTLSVICIDGRGQSSEMNDLQFIRIPLAAVI